MRRVMVMVWALWLGVGGVVAQAPSPAPDALPLALYGNVFDMAWRPHHEMLAVVVPDAVYLLDEQLQIVDVLPANAGWGRALWSPDGKWLTTFDGNLVVIWDVDTHTPSLTFPYNFDEDLLLPFFTWSPDSRYFAIYQAQHYADPRLSDPDAIKIWDVPAGELAHNWLVSGWLAGLAWNPADLQQLAVMYGNRIEIMDPLLGVLETTLASYTPGQTLVWSLDGQHLAVAGSITPYDPNSLLIWDVPAQQLLHVFPTYEDRGLLTLTWTARGLVSLEYDRQIRLWDSTTWVIQATYPRTGSVSADGRRLAVADNDLAIWDIEQDQRLAVNPFFDRGTRQVVWQPDGAAVLLLGRRGVVSFWDAADGSYIREFTTDGAWVAWRPDGRQIATISASNQLGVGWLKVWDVASGALMERMPARTARTASDDDAIMLSWSPDGVWLASQDATHVTVWDTSNWQALYTVAGTFWDWRPDGTAWVLATSDGRLTIRGSANGAEQVSLDVSGVARFDHLQVQWLAIGALMGNDRIAHFRWDTLTGAVVERQPLPTLDEAVYGLIWNEQGTAYILSLLVDRWLIWDVATETAQGERWSAYTYKSVPLWSPDGTRLVYIDVSRVWLREVPSSDAD